MNKKINENIRAPEQNISYPVIKLEFKLSTQHFNVDATVTGFTLNHDKIPDSNSI